MTSKIRVSALDDAPLSATHVGLLLAMAMAVMIDIMKPTALAFVMPGMTVEYGLKSPLNPNGTFPAAWVALVRYRGNRYRLLPLGMAGRQDWPARLDTVCRHRLYRHLDLRGDARLLLESGDVLPDGTGSGRHAAHLLCACWPKPSPPGTVAG